MTVKRTYGNKACRKMCEWVVLKVSCPEQQLLHLLIESNLRRTYERQTNDSGLWMAA